MSLELYSRLISGEYCSRLVIYDHIGFKRLANGATTIRYSGYWGKITLIIFFIRSGPVSDDLR